MTTKEHLRMATLLAHLLDDEFRILGFGVGLDPIIGLLPVGGDLVTFIAGLYLVWVGWMIQVPGEELAKMLGNLVADFFVGTLPIVGDVADAAFKANLKNLAILRKYEQKTSEGEYNPL